MTFYDGMGTYLRVWCADGWLYIGASMRVHTLLLGWLVYLVVGWGIYRWRRRKTGVK